MALSLKDRVAALQKRLLEQSEHAVSLFEGYRNSASSTPSTGLDEMIERIRMNAHSICYSPADNTHPQSGLPLLALREMQIT